MPYVPHSDGDRQAMLAAIGVRSIEELFADVPEHVRFPKLDLPPALSEMEARWELEDLAGANLTAAGPCFLGAGAYRHYVPAVVDSVLRRGEFYTAYTPYQPEVSQGTLQAIFEYQSMICALTGMEVANASHYDGATATAEAVITAINVHRLKRRKVVVSPYLHPEYRAVVRTYTQGMGLEVIGDQGSGSREQGAGLGDLLDQDTACVIVQYPDFLGNIEDWSGLAEAAHAAGALLVVAANPVALGVLKPPGAMGADIVVGEGQGMGAGLNFGGPYLGFFATREEYVRRMAGRLVGQTVDAEGKRGFVLTLSTREQHIRREKATSNICTNQGLVALAAAVYMAALGKCGMRRVAELCYHKAHYAAARIAELEGYAVLNDQPFFHEFVVRCPQPAAEINRRLLEEWGIIGGYDLGRDYPHLEGCMLLCVTEMNTREEIDLLVEALGECHGRGD